MISHSGKAAVKDIKQPHRVTKTAATHTCRQTERHVATLVTKEEDDIKAHEVGTDSSFD